MTIGFRFRPTDREIIYDYLLKKMDGIDFSHVIREIDLCRYDPWELPEISVLEDDEIWYFFCRPDYKYKKSKRLQRTTKAGRWKPTGKVRPVRGHGGKEIGTKRTLVFHSSASTGSDRGKATWVIHEYQVHNVLHGQEEFVFCKLKDKEGEPNNSSNGKEVNSGVQEGMVHHQHAQDASSTLFNLNNLSRMESNPTTYDGLSSEERDQIERLRLQLEDSDDEVDPSFADSFLVESVEAQAYFGHSENLEQIGSSRMYGGHGNAKQLRQITRVQTIHETLPSLSHDVDRSRIQVLQDPELETLRSSFEKVSVTHGRSRAVFPTSKSASKDKVQEPYNYDGTGSSRKGVKVPELKKIVPRHASASVINTKTSPFIHRKTASSSHQMNQQFVYLVNMIVVLILLLVFIMQMLEFPEHYESLCDSSDCLFW